MGTCIQQRMGPWLPTYDQYRFWHWRLGNSTHLMFQHSQMTQPRIALATQHHHTIMKFSPLAPMTLPFAGPPVMPIDPTTGYIKLPITPLPQLPMPSVILPAVHTIQKQFWASLCPWQLLLFGSLRKALLVNTMHNLLMNSVWLMIVSDASVQKNGKSGFVWVVAQNQTPIWRGASLAPGPETDIYSGRAEAFGLLAAITFVNYYVSCYAEPIPPTNMTCYCDNAGVITNLMSMTQSSGP